MCDYVYEVKVYAENNASGRGLHSYTSPFIFAQHQHVLSGLKGIMYKPLQDGKSGVVWSGYDVGYSIYNLNPA